MLVCRFLGIRVGRSYDGLRDWGFGLLFAAKRGELVHIIEKS